MPTDTMQTHTQELRHCKAWLVRAEWSDDPDGHVMFNETAGKARHTYIQWSDMDLKYSEIKVRRAKNCDRYLPTRHWIADLLSKQQQQIVSHAFGVGHRSYFNCSPGNSDLVKLVFEYGLFTGPHYEWSYFEKLWNYGQGDWFGCYYYLTSLGKDVARSLLPLDYWRLHEYQADCFVEPNNEV